MTKKNFVQLDESKFPTTKGKNIDGFRFYAVEDKHYPSITTVLGAIPKPGLDRWRKSVGEAAAKWEMNRAARRGSATHTLVEQYLKGETPSPGSYRDRTNNEPENNRKTLMDLKNA